MAMAPSELPPTLPTATLSSIRPSITPSTSSTTRTNTPSLRNPLPLSSAQEAQVRDLYYKKVRLKCADEIKEFALCAKGRTVTTSWTCRTQRFAMNSCMIAHATQENEDAAREEWFAGVRDRRKQREDDALLVEQRRTEVIELTRRQEEKERIEREREMELKEREKTRWKSGGGSSTSATDSDVAMSTKTEGEATKKRSWWG